MSWLGRGAIGVVVALAVGGACGDSKPKKPKPEEKTPDMAARRPAFAAGQKWAYRTRPADQGSYLVIGKVDDDARLGKIVHVSVFDVKNAAGEKIAIGHLPFSDGAIEKSVTEPQGDGLISKSFESGYTTWKEAFDKGKGGVFVMPVAQTLDTVLAAPPAP